MKALKLLEADVTTQVKDFMKVRGWRAIRHQRFVVPGAGQSGEPGQPDFCFLKYLQGRDGTYNGVCLVLWVELKRPKARQQCRCVPGRKSKCTMCAQRDWRAREEARGAIVVQVSDITDFKEWYVPRFAWSDTQKGLW
jgi:hypothetical protein